MSWEVLSGNKLDSFFVEIAQKSKGCDWVIHYSPGIGVTIEQSPDWETVAMQESVGNGIKFVRFKGVTPIEITTHDTLTMGSLDRIEFARLQDANVVTIIVKGLRDESYEVKFRFIECEFNTEAL